jgi:hypothetical protein
MFKKLIVIAVFAFAGLGLVSTQEPKTVEAAADKVTLCHATSSRTNPYGPKPITIDKNAVFKAGHDGHNGNIFDPNDSNQSNWGDIIPSFQYVEKGVTKTYPGKNLPAGQAWLDNGCQKPGTPNINYCDTTQVEGSVANWLAKNGINGADCFDYEVAQECGYLNVMITDQPEPQYPQGPYSAVYTTNGQVAFPASAFPATFAEDYNGGSVDVSWFTVGPESDWLKGFDFPNFWGGVSQTITVDTDCEKDETPVIPETPVTPITPSSTEVGEEKAQVEAPAAGVNAGSGDVATIATAAVTLVGSLVSLAYGVVRFTKFGA